MSEPRHLTDRAALAAHRRRAGPDGPRASFLHDIAADELHQKLADVNRTFTDIAVVSGFPGYWDRHFPGARHVPDEDLLDLPPTSYDLVIHAMTLHWANDPVGQIIQCRRALRPDGLFLAALFGGETLTELRTALTEAEAGLTGGLSPRVAPMAEIRAAGALLQRSGLALPVADGFRQTVYYRDTAGLFRDLRDMGETNALDARLRRAPPRQLFARTEAAYRAGFSDGDRLAATFEFLFLSGWAPDDSQPKPLRPGSATHRLADALSVPETPIPGKEGQQHD